MGAVIAFSDYSARAANINFINEIEHAILDGEKQFIFYKKKLEETTDINLLKTGYKYLFELDSLNQSLKKLKDEYKSIVL